ncbi:MAG TPA: HEAT repeat domain-containing protein [Candidatus Latescibacteria bacterium]|nr:HEAT repeat domain-containing protein [Candidatus Latescibacterota bacterium]
MTRVRMLATGCVFALSWCSRLPADVSSRYAAQFEEALASMAMSPADVTFRTDYVERDSFRLRRTDVFLLQPLSFADSLASFCAKSGEVGRPSPYVHLAADWLDNPLPPSCEPATRVLVRDTTRCARAFNRLAGAIEHAAEIVRASQSVFSPAERDTLSTWVDRVLSEGDPDASGEHVDLFAWKAEELAELQCSRANLELAKRWNGREILRATSCVASAAWELREALIEAKNRVPGPLPTRTWHTTCGRVTVGSEGQDNYTGDFALIVDPGGDDTYRVLPPGSGGPQVRVVIDISGNDVYFGSIAGSTFGIAISLDLSGDDTYIGEAWTQGAARFGAAILWDEKGNDTYSASRTAQGTGAFGLGLLVDVDGNDLYRSGTYGQGFGATGGIGILDDRKGNDSYCAGGTTTDVLRFDDHYLTMAQGVGSGIRPVASGGFGFLIDRAGNDVYNADVYGQGVGYWLGGGGLLDGEGHDRYVAHQYAQGAGIHLSSGALLDFRGDDVYVINGVGQGCGHDLGTGILFDETGDDAFTVEGLALGAGNANGISVFADVSGRDAYIARREDVMGYSDKRREYGMIGVMLDLAGEDRYAASFGANDRWWHHSTFGVGVDLGSAPPLSSTETAADPLLTEGEHRQKVAATPESLFVQASNPFSALQYLVEPAENRLANMGDSLVGFWAAKLASESARERWALVRIHQKLFARGDLSSVPMLIDSLESPSGSARRMAAHLLGFSKYPEAAPRLASLLRHPDWKTRQVAAESLWRLKDTRVELALVSLLEDSVALVRHAAALALQTCGTSRSDTMLVRRLSDQSQIVRYAAEQALGTRATARKLLLQTAVSQDTFAAMHALRALRVDTSDTSYAQVLRSILRSDTHWAVRAEVATSISALRIQSLSSDLQEARMRTHHAFLAQRLEEAITALNTANRRDE